MMYNRLKTFGIFLMILGAIAMGMNAVFGYGTISYIEQYREPFSGMWYYKFNFKGYFDNLINTLDTTWDSITYLPTRQWINMDATNFGTALSNNLLVMLNYVFFVINWTLLLPMKLSALLLTNVFAILGVNLNEDLQESPLNFYFNLIMMFRQSVLPYL